MSNTLIHSKQVLYIYSIVYYITVLAIYILPLQEDLTKYCALTYLRIRVRLQASDTIQHNDPGRYSARIFFLFTLPLPSTVQSTVICCRHFQRSRITANICCGHVVHTVYSQRKTGRQRFIFFFRFDLLCTQQTVPVPLKRSGHSHIAHARHHRTVYCSTYSNSIYGSHRDI